MAGGSFSLQSAQLDALINTIGDGCWLCDQAGTIVDVNDTGLQMFGLQRDEVVGKQLTVLSQLLVIERGERRRLGLRHALAGQPLRAECDVHRDGQQQAISIDFRAAPVRDQAGMIIGALTVVRDMTQQKAMLRLKDDFLAIAAHELKTPITVLKGYTQLILKRTRHLPQFGSIRRSLQTIDEQADRITALVVKLLDVTRIQAGYLDLRISTCDIQSLLLKTVEHVARLAPSHVFTVAPHAPVMLRVDGARIEQVVFNLLENAVKYSPVGRHIAVELVDGATDLRVMVHDQGFGIPPEKLPRIFDQWYQAHVNTHGDFGGMGLGLFICKEIVSRHGGSIWAEPNADGGTTIGFSLPRAVVDEPSTSQA